MKPAEIKAKINRIKEQLGIENIQRKTFIRYRDKINYDERMKKQQDIIDEAETAKKLIQRQFDTSLKEYVACGQRRRALKRELIILENYEKIEQLKTLAAQLRKETENGEANSNS